MCRETDNTSPTPEAHLLGRVNPLDQMYSEIHVFLADVRWLLLKLQDDPDEETIEQALYILKVISDGLEKAVMFRRLTTDLRDKMVAHLVHAAPNLKVSVIAGAAGYGDSYAARVAAAHGVARRPRREVGDSGSVN